ncbi:MAG: alpha-L-arabinofuranosidase [Chloroflexota bacterium]
MQVKFRTHGSRSSLMPTTMLLAISLLLAACASTPEVTATPVPVPTSHAFSSAGPDDATAVPSQEIPAAADSTAVPTMTGITVDLSAAARPFNPFLLGSNLPAWLGAGRTENETFLERTRASGISLIRLPGGSWSNYYDWLACEQDNVCPWEGDILTPTDFINFMNATSLPGMYTINMNGTAQEAAALVAFFNGSVTDETPIGVDVLGRDWGKVSDWAQLRADHGNPEPVGLVYWEIGNELYAGKPGMGTECTFEWGWEDGWTCDGVEYVTGIGEGAKRKDGFLDYAAAMKAVDPAIQIGAVGVNPPSEWTNWGNEVIAAAGEALDFYVVHEYGYFELPATYEAVLALPQAVWGPMMAGLDAAFVEMGNGRSLPIALTEYNLISFQDADNQQWMTRAVNMLYLADTLGQMAEQGIAIANQWNLVNGQAGNGTDYGLLHADTYVRYPQYYIFPLWSQFGTALLPVNSAFASDTTLSVYAGHNEAGAISLLAINKTGEAITSGIHLLNGTGIFTSGTADVVQAAALDSQTVTFNGVANPANDLSDAPSTALEISGNPFSYTFAPYSVTLIRLLP